jgi:cytochrome c-type biogenesis protein CcmH/NrfF
VASFAVELRDVRKRFGSVVALDGIAPRVNALASVLLAASFALLLVGGWLLDRGTQRRTP